LQEVNRNLAADTKVAVVTELLDILDDLERGASLDAGTGGSSTLETLGKKFESRQEMCFDGKEAEIVIAVLGC